MEMLARSSYRVQSVMVLFIAFWARITTWWVPELQILWNLWDVFPFLGVHLLFSCSSILKPGAMLKFQLNDVSICGPIVHNIIDTQSFLNGQPYPHSIAIISGKDELPWTTHHHQVKVTCCHFDAPVATTAHDTSTGHSIFINWWRRSIIATWP